MGNSGNKVNTKNLLYAEHRDQHYEQYQKEEEVVLATKDLVHLLEEDMYTSNNKTE